MRNVWVNNVLDSLTELLRAHLNDSLDKVAPELHVSTVFVSLSRAFEKMFSICVKYPKGLGKLFLQWIMDNHSGEILFHLERVVSGGRQDVSSMDAM